MYLSPKTNWSPPERQQRKERITASIDDAISIYISAAYPPSIRKTDDDNSAADKDKNPRSCLH